MAPEAPPRLSITTGWPSAEASFGCICRARMSVVPPGGQVTTSRIGRVGQAWACKIVGRASVAVAASKNLLRILVLLPSPGVAFTARTCTATGICQKKPEGTMKALTEQEVAAWHRDGFLFPF